MLSKMELLEIEGCENYHLMKHSIGQVLAILESYCLKFCMSDLETFEKSVVSISVVPMI